MKSSLRNTLHHNHGGWPAWIKSSNDGKGAPVGLNPRLADYLREEFRKHNLQHDPISIIDAAQRKSVSGGAQAFGEIWERVEDEACHVVFGSNLIEDAGAGLDYTINLCQHIFRGEHIDATDIGQGSPEYAKLLQDSEQQHGQQMSQPAIIRTRREVIQHAQALSWAIDNIVLAGILWTEDAVKTIHGILYFGMADHDVVPGKYRGPDHPIAAKYTDPKTGREKVTRFIHPRAVPSYMAAWVGNLNQDIERAESGAPFDPYDLPAKHYHHFINIHPFGDGNGRTSRIILNCLVMKFTGHLIPIGEDDKEKDEFLGIAVRGAKKYHEEDGEVYLDEQEGHREIAEFMARKSVKPLGRMLTWAEKY
ncbi:fido domain-containing protein [Nemania serpens]|nr:fido domain-containing protein [Nemania serpens]